MCTSTWSGLLCANGVPACRFVMTPERVRVLHYTAAKVLTATSPRRDLIEQSIRRGQLEAGTRWRTAARRSNPIRSDQTRCLVRPIQSRGSTSGRFRRKGIQRTISRTVSGSLSACVDPTRACSSCVHATRAKGEDTGAREARLRSLLSSSLPFHAYTSRPLHLSLPVHSVSATSIAHSGLLSPSVLRCLLASLPS